MAFVQEKNTHCGRGQFGTAGGLGGGHGRRGDGWESWCSSSHPEMNVLYESAVPEREYHC